MPLTTLKDILADPQRQGWAVPAFDVINQETVLAALEGAAAERAPVILMLLPSHTPLEHWPGLVALIEVEAERAGVPVCLHLDHATSLGQIRPALDVGLSSVMIDGSTLPLEENIAITRQAVEAAHPLGVSVEAELGHVGYGEEVLGAEEIPSRLTRVEEAAHFVAETGVDALAVSIGTIHGLYQGEPDLDFQRLEALRETVPVPLVLHGGSGTPDADIRRAVAGGICKINIWTEVALVFAAALHAYLGETLGQNRLHTAMAVARAGAQEVVQQKIRLLGAAGRAA